MAYKLLVVIVDAETNATVDLYIAEVSEMENLEQARLAAKIMAGVI